MNAPRKHWKRTAIWILPVAIGLAGFLLGWWMSGADRHDHGESTVFIATEKTGDSGVQQMYTCSMHPQVRSPNPNDKCPICGMDLIPVPMEGEAEEDSDLPRLRLTPRAAALMQIQVRPVEARRVQIPVRLFGRIGYDETRLRTIAAWMPGRLDRLYVDFTGTAVRQGQPMVEIYSPMLITAQEEYLQTVQTARELEKSGIESLRNTTRMTRGAAHDRLRLLGLDEEQIKRLEQQGRVEERLVIPAPLSGIVIERMAATGEYVETGQPIYRLADMSHLWVQLEVYESDVQWLKLGQKAVFTTQSYPGERFEGKVTFIDPILNERTRTVRVRVEVPNKEGRLKPGMFVRGVIDADEAPRQASPKPSEDHAGHGAPPNNAKNQSAGQDSRLPLAIPVTAPLITGERAVVYVQIPDAEQPTFEPRDIVLGPRAGAWYIVREGLTEGELVVTHGSFKIDSELQIRGRPSMMQPEGGPPPTHDHGDTAANQPSPRSETVQAPSQFQMQIGRIVISNFDLVDALAADDPEAARRAALQTDEALHRVDPATLTNNRQQWNRVAKNLHDPIVQLANNEDLKEQRRLFKSFSDALIEAVRTFGVAQTGEVYLVMCPMVEGGKGYWLQSQKDITNPYLGSMMLTCGEIMETIVQPDEHSGGHG